MAEEEDSQISEGSTPAQEDDELDDVEEEEGEEVDVDPEQDPDEDEDEDVDAEDDDVDYEDDDEDEDENMTVEEKLEKLQDENEELQAIIKSIMDQYNHYKEIVDRDKDNEKARTEALKAQIEELKLLVEQLEESQISGDSILQKKLDETTAKLAASEQTCTKLRAQTSANLEAIKQQMQIAESTNMSLNEELNEERNMHRQTLMQLLALQKEAKMPAPTVRDQEIRLRVSFDGPSITGAKLIPENDEERAKLKEEKDFFKEKFLALKQEQVMMKQELEESQQKLKETLDKSEKVSTDLVALKERHAQALKEIDRLKEQSPASSNSASPMTVPAAAGDRRSCKLPTSDSMMTVMEDANSRFSDGYNEALRIYEAYFLAGAKMELPVSQDIKHKLFRSVREQDVRPNMFAEAKKELLTHMDSNFFEEWKKEQQGDCVYNSFGDVLSEAGEKAAELKANVTKFFAEKKEKPEFMSFLNDTTAFALQKFTRSSSLSDIGSLSHDSEKKHHKKKKHSHKSGKSKTPDVDDQGRLSKQNSSLRKSCPPGAIEASSTASASPVSPSSAGAPPLPPLPTASTQSQPVSSANSRRFTSPSVDDLQSMFVKADPVHETGQVENQEDKGQQKQPRPQVISRTVTSPAGNLSALLQGGVGASGNLTSPRTAAAMGRRTIRKTSHFRQLATSTSPENGIPSLYGGPVSPEQLTPRTVSSMMAELRSQASDAAPIPHFALDGIDLSPTSPVSPKATAVSPRTTMVAPKAAIPSGVVAGASPARHGRQPSMSTALTRNTTMLVQKLQEFVGSGAHQDVSLLTIGNVKAITAVESNVWVAHNNPTSDGKKVSSIAVYNRDTLIQRPEVNLPEVTVNNMIFAGRQVWLATSSPELLCVNPVDPLFQHLLKGHSAGSSITDLAWMGKHIWTIGTDQQIGVWDVANMKLRKMIKGSVMNTIIRVAGFAWIGTVRGIQRYNTETLKLVKESALFGEAAQYLKMAVTKLLLVNNYVWAVHHDEGMISVWDAESKMFVTAFEVPDVVAMIHIGSQVWMTSHNHVIRCYDVTDFNKVGELTGMHQDWVTCMTVARHKDSLRVWSGSTDATIVLWDACVRPHDFVSVPSRAGYCDVCKKTLKSFGGKILVCRNCDKIAIHSKCRDLLPVGCACSVVDPSNGIEHSVGSAAKL